MVYAGVISSSGNSLVTASEDLHTQTLIADELPASRLADTLRMGKAIVDRSSSMTSTTRT